MSTPVLDTAVAYWRALDYDDLGFLVDMTGNGHNAQLGSDHIAYIGPDYDGVNCLRLPGAASNNATIPDSAALDITGDIDIRVLVEVPDWTAAGGDLKPITKWQSSGNQKSWSFYIDNSFGQPRFYWTEDGSTGKDEQASTGAAAEGLSDGDKVWLRVTLEVDVGGTDAEVKFYKGGSADTPSWTQWGATQTVGATTSIFSGSGNLVFGDTDTSFQPCEITLYRAIIYADLTETDKRLDVDFTAEATGTTSFTEDSSNAATVTVNQSGDDTNDPVQYEPDGYVDYDNPGTQYAYFPGTANNNVSVAGLSNSTTYDFTVTYSDDTTAAGTEDSDGSGNLVLGNDQSEFDDKKVKSINVYPDGGTGSGDTVAFADFTDRTAIVEPFASFTGDEGKTWTINRSATGAKSTIVDYPMFMLHTDDYLEVADHDDLDFGASDDFTVLLVGRTYDSGNQHFFFAKKESRANSHEGYMIRKLADDTWGGEIADGTTEEDHSHGAVTSGTRTEMALVRDVTGNTVESYQDAVASGSPTTDDTNDLSSAVPLLVGAGGVTPSNYQDGEFFGAAIFDSALSTDDLATAADELMGIVAATASGSQKRDGFRFAPSKPLSVARIGR